MATKSKFCARCFRSKSLDRYTTSKKAKDGKHCYCNDCLAELANARYRKDPKHGIAVVMRYRRTSKGRAATSRANKKSRSKPGYREKFRSYHREWRLKNPDKWNACIERRVARKRSVEFDFTQTDKDYGLQFFGFSCALCSTSFEKVEPTWDHWIPLSNEYCLGTVPENMVPVCRPCNSAKQDRIVESASVDSFLDTVRVRG